MTLDATVVVPGIIATASVLFWSLLRASSLVARAEERITSTLYRTSCDKCSREWEWVAKPFDPDLGATFDRSEECPACLYEARRVIELDLDDITPAQIRAAFNTEEETTLA